MNHEQVRQDQSQEFQRRTLSERPGFERKSPRKSFVAKGHDAILKGVQDVGGRVIITTMGDGTEHIGKLVARDKYTITIFTDGGSSKTFYKHAIESFEPLITAQAQVQ